MTYQIEQKDSVLSKWAKTIAVLSLQLLILSVLLHRFASLSTPVAMNLFAICLGGGVLAILFAIAAWIRIWDNGDKGAMRAGIAVLVSFVIFAYPIWLLPQVLALPLINDVTTDMQRPPAFTTLADERPTGSNPPQYPGAEFAKQQAEAYPDIQPIFLERSTKEAFEIAQEAVRRMKWKVAAQYSPGERDEEGHIEARDKTLILGFVDDVSIRVSGSDAKSRIDIRSASRYGSHDLGRNAERIRALVTGVKETLVDGERAAAAKREARIKAEKKKKAEMERRQALRRKRAYRARARIRRARQRKKQQLWPF